MMNSHRNHETSLESVQNKCDCGTAGGDVGVNVVMVLGQ